MHCKTADMGHICFMYNYSNVNISVCYRCYVVKVENRDSQLAELAVLQTCALQMKIIMMNKVKRERKRIILHAGLHVLRYANGDNKQGHREFPF